MNPAEAAVLLARASGVDGRAVGEPQARVWAHLLRDVNLADALEAVDAHYSTSDRFLYPVHVIDGAKRIVDQREGALRRAELDAQISAENDGELAERPVRQAIESAMPSAPPPFEQKRPADIMREAVGRAKAERQTEPA